MKRRTLLAGTGVASVSAVAGCLGDTIPGTETDDDTDPSDERREAACSHMPVDAEQLAYEWNMQYGRTPVIAGGWSRDEWRPNDDTTPFALVATADDLETRLQLDRLDGDNERHESVKTYIQETDLETEALLIWQTQTLSGGYQIEPVGVDRSAEESIHAYTCRYHGGGGNGDSEDPYTALIRIEVPQQPTRAKLTHRRGNYSGDSHETTTYEDSRETGR